MLGTRLATSRLSCTGLRTIKPQPTSRIIAPQTKLLSGPVIQRSAMRAFGGGTAGYTKLITVFGSIGGIAVFLALCTVTIGEYLGSIIMGIFAFFLYFLLGDSNLHRHQVTGAKNFQEIHVWFTLSFLVVIYAFY